MARLDRRLCGVCGKGVNFIGNRKLTDGMLCQDCAKKISPYMSGRSDASVEDMKLHLEYRKNNAAKLHEFKADVVFGIKKKVYVDNDMQAFILSTKTPEQFEEENPDIIYMSDVLDCKTVILEDAKEQYNQDESGRRVSFVPPKYKYFYTFRTTFTIDNPRIKEVHYNSPVIEGRGSIEYKKCQEVADKLHDMFSTEITHKERDIYSQEPVRPSL